MKHNIYINRHNFAKTQQPQWDRPVHTTDLHGCRPVHEVQVYVVQPQVCQWLPYCSLHPRMARVPQLQGLNMAPSLCDLGHPHHPSRTLGFHRTFLLTVSRFSLRNLGIEVVWVWLHCLHLSISVPQNTQCFQLSKRTWRPISYNLSM